jgi:hypothetical protein
VTHESLAPEFFCYIFIKNTSSTKYIEEMIQELIFLLVILVIILAVFARQPRSILRACEDTTAATPSAEQQPRTTSAVKTRTKTNRVRFSPDKKERIYSIKTGEIVGDNIIPVEDTELQN